MNNQVYMVKQGDTLYGIAKANATTVGVLQELNNLNSTSLSVNQKILLPTTATTSESMTDYIIYTVKAGDNLYNISKVYQVSISDIKELNNLSSNNLSLNQKLKIPIKSDSSIMDTGNYVEYIIKQGDTLYSIAQKFNTTVDQILIDNNLTNSNLSLGQKIIINDKNASSIEECFGESYVSDEKTVIETYVVKKGDTLYQIAKNYGINTNDIINQNNLKTSALMVGQILEIPLTAAETNYEVKSGDSLYSIAQNFNTTVDAIKNKNNLTTNLLSIGQKLKI